MTQTLPDIEQLQVDAGDRERLLEYYRRMLEIRRVEERLSQLFADSEIPGFIHLSIGQESIPVGVSQHLSDRDTIAVTHRGHGHAIAKGIPLERFFAEVMGRDSGVCRGRGGSMHIADASIGMLGANGIVTGGVSIATGSALAHKLDGAGAVAVSYFGDGALAEGILHECLNLAALWQLPCLFVCENNGWGEFSPSEEQFCGRLHALAEAFSMCYDSVDGLNVLDVADVAERLLGEIRVTGAPAVLECHVERFHGHFEGDPQKYRSEEEKSALRARDPLLAAASMLRNAGVEQAAMDEFDRAVVAHIDSAVEFAKAAPVPSFADARADVYAGTG